MKSSHPKARPIASLAFGIIALLACGTPANAQVCSTNAIREAASEVAYDEDYLLAVARRESSLNFRATARNSTAAGLFQFTEDTWFRLIDRFGQPYGLGAEANAISIESGKPVVDPGWRNRILDLRFDAKISTVMAARLSLENGKILQSKLGREASDGELYVAHFLGAHDASRLIRAAERDEPGAAAKHFERAAAANPQVFWKNGAPLTAREVVRNLVRPFDETGRSSMPAQAASKVGACS